MTILVNTIEILSEMRPAFKQERTWLRGIGLSLACLYVVGRARITQLIISKGMEFLDWSADYRLFSRCRFSQDTASRKLLEQVWKEMGCPNVINVAIDATGLVRGGRRVSFSSWMKDPMGPPFQVNLVKGVRYLHASVIFPLYKRSGLPPRAIPIALDVAPSPKKPKKNASEEERREYNRAKKLGALSLAFVDQVKRIRRWLDEIGASHVKLEITADGAFCNRKCLGDEIEGIELVTRTRKNAVLCFRANQRGPRFYSNDKFTPESVRKDGKIPWKNGQFFYGGKLRKIYYKEVTNVLWQGATKRRVLKLIVIRGIPYRISKKAKQYYRDPAYLLCSEDAKSKHQVQVYLDRWQIEVAHRDMKDNLGLGQAQVWTKNSVQTQPFMVAISYGALILASIRAYNDHRGSHIQPTPKWRRGALRPSCQELLALLRREMHEQGESLAMYGFKPPNYKRSVLNCAA